MKSIYRIYEERASQSKYSSCTMSLTAEKATASALGAHNQHDDVLHCDA
jgi:hypothetical protein